MKMEDQMKRLGAFVCREQRRSISTIIVKDGIAYATDGRLLVYEKLDEPHEDVVKREDGETLLVDSVIAFCKYPQNAKKWYSISMDTKWIDDILSEKFKAEVQLNDRNYREHYKLVRCPKCGDDIWFDTFEERLIDMPEPKDVIEIRDVRVNAHIVLGDNDISVNYAYIFLLTKMYEGVMFSCGYVKENDKTIIFFRTKDGKAGGVLMPLYVPEGDTLGHEIRTKEVSDADAGTT